MGSKKEKHKGKDNKHKSHDKHRKHRKHKSSRRDRGSSSGSDSDSPRDANAELERSRRAARAMREILGHDYALKADLREVITKLDRGEALSVEGVQDHYVRSRLHTMLTSLPQVKATPTKEYFKRSGRNGSGSILAFLAPILNESREQLAAYAPVPRDLSRGSGKTAGDDVAASRAGVRACNPPEQRRPGPATAAAPRDEPSADKPVLIGAAMPPPGFGGGLGVNDGSARSGLPEGEPASSDDGPGNVDGSGARGASQNFPDDDDWEHRGQQVKSKAPDDNDDAQAVPPGPDPAPQTLKKVLGPAMPPPEVLAAAATAGGPGTAFGDDFHDDDGGDFLGPMPPEIEAEVEAAGDDERAAEVNRILRVLTEHRASLTSVDAAEALKRPPDAYAVLGLDPATPSSGIKRRYMRVSLLIHPDKCAHTGAADAFQAVAAAAATLQDQEKRTELDAAREDAALREEFLKESAARDRARKWRVARGQATAEDLASPTAAADGGFAEPRREAWMTELPPERSAGAGIPASGGPFRGFSQSGVKPRGDTSGWTMTPSQRAAQLEGGGGTGAGPSMLADAPTSAPVRASAEAAAMDAFNTTTRKRSLLEEHQARKAEESRRKRKGSTAGPAAAAEGWDPATQPWRPFDREKDLVGARGDVKSAQGRLAAMPSLASRFGSLNGNGGGSQRTFL